MRDARKIHSFDFLKGKSAFYRGKEFYYFCTWVVNSNTPLYITLINEGVQINFPSKEAIELILNTKYAKKS